MSGWKKMPGGHRRPEIVCCFLCKDDSDDLCTCDFRDCCKVYHPSCLEDKHGVLPSPEEQFVCDWHTCFNCGQSSHFQCMCCPISVCHDCLGKVGFVELGMLPQKGFCTSCLNKAILIEKDADPDPRWVQSDYSNAETRDLLFKDYWEDVKDREHLKLAYLEEAHVILNRKLDYNRENPEKFPYEDHKSGEKMLRASCFVGVEENNSKGAAEDVVESLGVHKEKPTEGKEKDNASCLTDVMEKSKGNTSTFLSPLSPGATQQIANSLNDHQVEPPREENILECIRILEAKPIKGNTNTLVLPFPHGVRHGAGSSDLQVRQTKDAAEDDVVEPLRVHEEKQTKAGEALRSGVAPDSGLHSQMLNTQDESCTEVIDIDKDESKHSRYKDNSGANIEEAIILDSDEDEDVHTVEPSLESKVSYASRAMSGVHLHMEQLQSASAVSSLTPMWNYVDPQGNTRGPFPLSWLFCWSGFFDKDFKVWRTGETAEQAILLTDAFLMYL